MTIHFNPPQLAAARNAGTLCRLATELGEPDVPAEIRVLQSLPDCNTRVVFITQGEKPASLELPRNWLYSELTEDQVREPLEELLHVH